ncbi:SGNH/GDSL hydrolase family protein [Selenomonas montiformis]|uniref:SGNH/GDSL hydrolase family protein n=1 Tax=Selenomonas montiformis TaxID=2652285 RepID=UPI003F8A92E1
MKHFPLLPKRRIAILAACCLMGTSAAFAAPIPATHLISRGVPAYASSDKPELANDANYQTTWNGKAPGWLAYDLSKVPQTSRAKSVVVWYSSSYDYDPTIKQRLSYGNLQNYTIEGNTAAGGKLPTSGWQTLVTVKDNVYHSRQHVLDLSKYNWVRVHVGTVDNASGPKAAINLDVYEAKDGLADDWIVYGDSITAGSGNFSGSPYGPAGQLVNAANPAYYPIFEYGGTGSIKSKDGVKNIDNWLSVFPGKYVGIVLGTNDSWGNGKNMEKYYENMDTIVQKVLAAGKVPVVGKIPWSAEPGVADNAPLYNAKIDELYKKYPKSVLKGPDFWAIFKDHRDWLGPDGVHPSPKGYGMMRKAWAETMLSVGARKGKAQELTPELAKASWHRTGSEVGKGSFLKGEQTEIDIQKVRHAAKTGK